VRSPSSIPSSHHPLLTTLFSPFYSLLKQIMSKRSSGSGSARQHARVISCLAKIWKTCSPSADNRISDEAFSELMDICAQEASQLSWVSSSRDDSLREWERDVYCISPPDMVSSSPSSTSSGRLKLLSMRHNNIIPTSHHERVTDLKQHRNDGVIIESSVERKPVLDYLISITEKCAESESVTSYVSFLNAVHMGLVRIKNPNPSHVVPYSQTPKPKGYRGSWDETNSYEPVSDQGKSSAQKALSQTWNRSSTTGFEFGPSEEYPSSYPSPIPSNRTASNETTKSEPVATKYIDNRGGGDTDLKPSLQVTFSRGIVILFVCLYICICTFCLLFTTSLCSCLLLPTHTHQLLFPCLHSNRRLEKDQISP